jgi:tetratricopeptide (TPR) repeat protein
MAFRSIAYVQLAEIALAAENIGEAERYARLALDYDQKSIPARRVLAIVGRRGGDKALATRMRESILEIDPLNHFARSETLLSGSESSEAILAGGFRSEYPEQSLLEIAIDYASLGVTDDAVSILELGGNVFSNPLFRAWQAWLENDPTLLAEPADPRFVFPYRPETHEVLSWATEYVTHWSWSYLLALNLWALDREDEAAERLEALRDVPDFGPAYVARASLLARLSGRDEEADLRRAVQLEGDNRTIRIHLIRYLQGQERWEDALDALNDAQSQFPDDFNLDLLQVRALNNLGRPREAIEILANTHVLPSENARESHRLYEQAHTLAALDALDGSDLAEARRLLQAALEWPEHLGQGRPYDPEERIVRLLLGQVELASGNMQLAREAAEAVVAATNRHAVKSNRLDLLVFPALVCLGQTETLEALEFGADTDVGLFADELIDTVVSGGDVDAVLTRLAVEHAGLFDDLQGSILLRVLTAMEYGRGEQ